MKKEFKVGDKVVMKGVVVSKHKNTEHEYKVCVDWSGPNFIANQYYFQDGRYSTIDAEPTIFHENQERVVQVREHEGEPWNNRVLIKESMGKFVCWDKAETIGEAESGTHTIVWRFMREVPEKRVLTMQEIAEKFNIDVEQIEIEK
jgi:hypothetical protein